MDLHKNSTKVTSCVHDVIYSCVYNVIYSCVYNAIYSCIYTVMIAPYEKVFGHGLTDQQHGSKAQHSCHVQLEHCLNSFTKAINIAQTDFKPKMHTFGLYTFHSFITVSAIYKRGRDDLDPLLKALRSFPS